MPIKFRIRLKSNLSICLRCFLSTYKLPYLSHTQIILSLIPSTRLFYFILFECILFGSLKDKIWIFKLLNFARVRFMCCFGCSVYFKYLSHLFMHAYVCTCFSFIIVELVLVWFVAWKLQYLQKNDFYD